MAPAVQRRQRESLELQMGATTVGDGWGVRDIGRVAAVGLVDQDTTGNASAFARGNCWVVCSPSIPVFVCFFGPLQ